MRAALPILASLGCAHDPCSQLRALEAVDIVAVGDSALAFGAGRCESAVDFASLTLGRRIRNAAVGGSQVLGGKSPIPDQVPPGDWGQVIVIGGANDLSAADVCDGADPTPVLDRLATTDGREGAMPAFVDRLLARGSSVVLLGYYRTPKGGGNSAGGCGDEVAELRARTRATAESRLEVDYLDLGLAIGAGDEDLLASDRVHPSAAGAEALGELLAEALAR